MTYEMLLFKRLLPLLPTKPGKFSIHIDGFIHAVAYAGMSLAKAAMWTDRYIIDGFLNLIVAVVQSIANFARRFQGGKVQYYIYSMLVVILVIFILTTLI